MPNKTILRVFPQRTALTPTDALAFIGEPPSEPPPADEVHISVCFSWDVEEAVHLLALWGRHYATVRIGGPAFGGVCAEFVPGRYVAQGVTFTTRGCSKRCPWCLVPAREGPLTVIPDFAPGHIIQDNNLLQAPREHLLNVFTMLGEQPKAAVFSGGLGAAYVDDWVAEQLYHLRIREVYLAADTDGSLRSLRQAVTCLTFLKRRQLRCYMLLAFEGETVTQAEARLEAVWEIGCLPFAQLYQPDSDYRILYSPRWRRLARLWSRPAATFAAHKK